MNKQISLLIEKIRLLEEDLELEFAKRRAELSFSIHNRKVIFEQEVSRRHKQFKIKVSTYILQAKVKVIATAPLIYALIVPFLLLDLMVSLYQWVCFPVYGIAKVNRASYFVYDRHHLAYLNVIEKLNCAYCSYGTGLIAYVREIAARTEQYWYPIKHAQRMKSSHAHYSHFLDYGDAENYRTYLKTVQRGIKSKESTRNK